MRMLHFAAKIVSTLLILFSTAALATTVTAQYRGTNYTGRLAEGTAQFGDGTFRMELTIAGEGGYSFRGPIQGAQVEGSYVAPTGYGGGYFKAVFSGVPSGNAVPNEITLYHTNQLLWPTKLHLVAAGAGGAGAGNAPGGAAPDQPPQLEAMLTCDSQPFVITISQLPSRGCTLWIGNWVRNSAALVQVIALDAIDGYGNHPNGIQVFGAHQLGTAQGVAGFAMGGYGGPDGSYGKWFPWNLLIFACPAPPGAGTNCFGSETTPGNFAVRLLVRQDGARDANVLLAGTALPSPYGPTGAAAAGNAGFFRIRNQWQPARYINVETGALSASPIRANLFSAQWVLEPVPGTGFVRIGSRWRPGEYLNIERGLRSGRIAAQWWSAMWSIEPVENTVGVFRIRNRWRPEQFLNIESGQLRCTPVSSAWWSAMWVFER